jgi:hypothetical protein
MPKNGKRMRIKTIDMKTFFILPLYLALLCDCAPKEKTTFGFQQTDSVELIGEKAIQPTEIKPSGKIPIDTIVASYPNGKKLLLLVLEYYDSLPDKPIKDFEVKEADTEDVIFRAVTKRLALGDEVDPINGRFDSLFVVPTYSISSKDPLTVDLDFLAYGGLSFAYIGDITYPFYKESAVLKFVRYTFLNGENLTIESSLLFIPHECSITENELMDQFNKIKRERNLDTESGGELMKSSFICFLNGKNKHYDMIDQEFKQECGEFYFPYNYYVYIVYLDKFIVNLISQ